MHLHVEPLLYTRGGLDDAEPDGVALVEVAAEQAVIAEARTLRSAGLSLRKVAELLDRKGLRARTGRTFAAAISITSTTAT